MKKKYTIIGGLLCLLLCSSCDKFLELTPRDKKVVSTIEDYRDIMASYMYYLKTPNRYSMPILGLGSSTAPLFDLAGKLGIYTGETTLNVANTAYYDNNKGEYTMDGKNLLTWLDTDAGPWKQYYEFLGPINLIISGITTAEGTDENLRNYVKGGGFGMACFCLFQTNTVLCPLSG